MVKLNKIYTKTGDSGITGLGNGERVTKDSLRVTAYGNVDELNASLGLVTNFAKKDLKNKIINIQNDLFDLGADLCLPIASGKSNKLKISSNHIKKLEQGIDEMNEQLKPLESFILPGGSKTAAFLHMARTICRRSERSIVSLKGREAVNDNILKYINRLSDWLFVASRLENQKESSELLWKPGKNK